MPNLPAIFHSFNSAPPAEDSPLPIQQLQIVRNEVHNKISALFPMAPIDLTPEESQRIRMYQEAAVILGPVAKAPMTCSMGCPFALQCPLVQINKQPVGAMCPFESSYVVERFSAWLGELERNTDNLLESERVTVSNLVYLDLYEQRCTSRLSQAEHASLITRSVRDIDLDTGQPVCYEDVIAIERQNLTQIQMDRRMLLKDFELTPEQKTKRRKALGPERGSDLSSRMSKNTDKLREAKARAAQKVPASQAVIEIVPVLLEVIPSDPDPQPDIF